MKKEIKDNLSYEQKKAIADQLANFFFEYWNNRPPGDKSLNKEDQSHCLGSGFSEEFSRSTKTMT